MALVGYSALPKSDECSYTGDCLLSLHSTQESEVPIPGVLNEGSRHKNRDAKLLSRLLQCLSAVNSTVPDVLLQ